MDYIDVVASWLYSFWVFFQEWRQRFILIAVLAIVMILFIFIVTNKIHRYRRDRLRDQA